MTRVLYVAHAFPPIGGAGVQRNARFVRRLPGLGYDPVVVTGPGGTDGRWTPADETLVSKLPADVEVHRIATPEPPVSDGWRERGERWLGLRPPVIDWLVEGAVDLGREVGRDTELVYVSVVPYEMAEIGLRLSRDLGKPWVADLQDPWALDEMWIYPTRWHRNADLRRMRRLLATAAAIVMNTPEAAKRLVDAFPELGDKIVVSITNGWDEQDFAAPVEPRDDGTFRIAHTGSLHTSLGMRHRRTLVKRLLGGTAMEIDILTRTHIYLLQALDRLVADDPSIADDVEVHFAGPLTALDREIAARSPLTRLHGYLPHDETLALARTADMLFLPMQKLAEGQRAGLTPGKTYEYLASGTKILAAVPEGDARDLLVAAGARVVRPDDVDGMASAIAEEVRRWRGGHPAAPRRDEVVAPYEAQALSEDLAAVFDRVRGVRSRTAVALAV